MTTGKTIALTRQTFVAKVISLLLNMLSRLVILALLSDIGAFCKHRSDQEGMMLKLKLQYFGHLIGKDSDAGRDWGQEEKGMTEDEMAGWHH